jgi:hypothetical protein
MGQLTEVTREVHGSMCLTPGRSSARYMHLSSLSVTGLIGKGGAQYLREGFIAEGLTQSRAVAKSGRKRF